MQIRSKNECLENSNKVLNQNTKILRESKLNNLSSLKEDSTIPTSTTGLKEGLVMYFACQDTNAIDAAINKIETKSNKRLNFLTGIVSSKLYDGNVEPASKNVIAAIKYLNTNVVEPKIAKTYINAMISAKRIIKDIGILDPKLVDRGKTFDSIKSHATDLLKGMDISITSKESDKWCPADIFIYGSSGAITVANESTNINIDSKIKPSLNSIFSETFTKPDGNTILGISLKEEFARAGKATSFRKILKGDEDYVIEDKDQAQEFITKLLYNFSSITRIKGANTEPIYKIGDCAEALNTITKNETLISKNVSSDVLENLKQSLAKVLKSTFGKDAKLATNKDNAKNLYKSGTFKYPSDTAKSITELKTFITEFRSSLIEYAKAKYTKSRKDFFQTLKKTNFKPPTNPPVKWAETEDVSKVSDIFLKKAGCYEAASKLLDGYQLKAALSLPKAFKSIVDEEKNVFLALTAYAVSQGGISPTFFKLIGKESSSQEAEVKTFPSDGVLKLVSGGEVEIDDSPTNAGFNVTFICQIKSEKGIADKYKVVLSFSYAGTQFKIEVFELKEA